LKSIITDNIYVGPCVFLSMLKQLGLW